MAKIVDFLTEEQVTRAILLGVVICWDKTFNEHRGQPPWFVYGDKGFLSHEGDPNPNAYWHTPEAALADVVKMGGDLTNWYGQPNAGVTWSSYPPRGGVRKSGANKS